MGRKRRQLTAVGVAAAVAVGLAGCGGGGGTGGSGGPQERTEATQGGTLFYLQNAVTEHLDPQRTYVGRDISNLDRMVYRGWVSFPAGATTPEEGSTVTPDLATDTGTSNEDATEWSFTLRDDAGNWQDGEPITCEDFKYGVSRTFATDIITGGPNYILGYLDVPLDENQQPLYQGPYSGEGQSDFDKAVTCDGNTITYRFRKPWPDFPLAVASLLAFEPYREDLDRGDNNDLQVISNGPYMLDGEWTLNGGGTFIRNPEWDADTDDLREANPDQITFEIGVAPEVINERLIADSGDDQFAVTTNDVPPAQYGQIEGAVADRAANVTSPFTDYVVPNFSTVTDPQVRQAIAAGIDRESYVAALGGERAASPSVSVVNPDVPGYTENPAFADVPLDGDPDAAEALLEESGVDTPYPLKFTYPIGNPALERAFASVKESLDAVGFEVELDGLDPAGPYYDTIQNPGSDSDLIWAGWGADWPSVNTVIPPLFDSRVNLTETSNGQDYGNYDSDEVNTMIDDAAAEVDLDAANEMFARIDARLGEDVAYVPLSVTQFYFLRGSGVENYVNSPSTSGYPDLGVISLAAGGS